MTQLNAQDIASFCDATHHRAMPWRWHDAAAAGPPQPVPMVQPFRSDRVIIRGRSAGLSAASYDVRIASDLTLGPQPQFTIARALADRKLGEPAAIVLDKLHASLTNLLVNPPYALANTLEDFAMPLGVAGYVIDKSTHARLFVGAFNTYLDPGWRGNLTLELVNLSDRELVLKQGDPICQIVFHFLSSDTDRGYSGKYQDQPKRPVGAILENQETGL
jgi:dCTP deaminase